MAEKILIPVRILSMNRTLFFASDSEDYKVDDLVICETTRGKELGKITGAPVKKEVADDQEYPLIVAKGDNNDLIIYNKNIELGSEAKKIAQDSADKLGLDMKVVSAEYTLDASKVTIYYLSESRVDFRELLKVLAASLKCHLDLRQIGTRDKAKLIGGIGICGLKLCCSSFLNEFDGISITMAKNQMLALNIPKLSGHCGKLICCLKYENDTYSDLQKDLPRIGSHVRYEGGIYKITSMNVITKMIRIENKENIQVLPYSQIQDNIISKEEFALINQQRQQQMMNKKNNEENNSNEQN
jgi:cell fate regulator YaaT (PSP1 superfamily)